MVFSFFLFFPRSFPAPSCFHTKSREPMHHSEPRPRPCVWLRGIVTDRPRAEKNWVPNFRSSPCKPLSARPPGNKSWAPVGSRVVCRPPNHSPDPPGRAPIPRFCFFFACKESPFFPRAPWKKTWGLSNFYAKRLHAARRPKRPGAQKTTRQWVGFPSFFPPPSPPSRSRSAGQTATARLGMGWGVPAQIAPPIYP